jgi:hypothetical protein
VAISSASPQRPRGIAPFNLADILLAASAGIEFHAQIGVFVARGETTLTRIFRAERSDPMARAMPSRPACLLHRRQNDFWQGDKEKAVGPSRAESIRTLASMVRLSLLVRWTMKISPEKYSRRYVRDFENAKF